MLFHLRGTIESTRGCDNPFAKSRRFSLGTRLALVGLLLFALGLHTPLVAAQGLDPAALLKPATNTWPTYNGDYSGARYSSLDQINASNVNSLTLAWIFRAHGSVLTSTPLEVNGILYFTAPDNVWAVDARYGR